MWTRAERRALTFAHTDSWIASPSLRWAGELLASLSARWRALSCARDGRRLVDLHFSVRRFEHHREGPSAGLNLLGTQVK